MGKGKRSRASRVTDPAEKVGYKIRELRRKKGYHSDCIKRLDVKIDAAEKELKKLKEND